MNSKQKTSLGLALGLPVAAASVLVSLPATVQARGGNGENCYYNSNPLFGGWYSPGSCIQSVCPPGKSQGCMCSGDWSGCGDCSGADCGPPL